MRGRERWGDRRSGNAVEVRVAARLDNLAVLRTVAAAIGAFARLDDAAVADLRLAVEVSVPGDDEHSLSPGSFSWYVLSSLADHVEPFRDGDDPADPDWLMGIRLTTRRMHHD